VTLPRVRLNPFWLIFSLPVYIGWRLLPALANGPIQMGIGVALLVGCCVLVPVSVRVRSLRNSTLATLLAWMGLLSMGFFSSLFALALLRDVVLLGAHMLLSVVQTASLAASSARWTVALAALVIGFCGAGGVWLFRRLTRWL